MCVIAGSCTGVFDIMLTAVVMWCICALTVAGTATSHWQRLSLSTWQSILWCGKCWYQCLWSRYSLCSLQYCRLLHFGFLSAMLVMCSCQKLSFLGFIIFFWGDSSLWVIMLHGPVRAPGHDSPLIRVFTLVLYIMFACLYRIFPTSFFSLFPYLFPSLSFPLRIDPLRFQTRCLIRQLNLALVFCVVVHFFDWWMRAFVVLGLVFSIPSLLLSSGK